MAELKGLLRRAQCIDCKHYRLAWEWCDKRGQTERLAYWERECKGFEQRPQRQAIRRAKENG